ncbi:PDR/VanB family oxidoreductase [Herbaspirillum sp. SJZ099]|uniref:PDR/VanB family oxidoreductase n=1 Tax=Herbaspirillum sp. SJZ099 TaxID=2572916 RepID=UPI0011A91766|nr:PDR/VanB family oxidoreductase [Herbaspirillum sp. SJZ099]TWC68171.1 vanillate O-demethylase ferredoxin subunit [Herbaspirillum sp. SJZ099]
MSQLQVRVTARREEAEGIVSLELAAADGKPLPPFTAGSHIDVHLPGGLVRQYSLCNPPHESHRYQIGVLRDPNSRGGSAAVHEAVRLGDVISISEPRNHFPLAQARRTLLLAGGIGVTPILCMAERLAAANAEFEMHYCTRSPGRTAFRERIAQSAFAGRVVYHHDDGEPAQKLDLATLIAVPDADTHIYVCGPSGFIGHVVDTAKAIGWPAANVHLEYFGAAPAAGDGAGDTAFDVKLASSGQVFTIPVGRTVIQVLAEHGVELPVSCEQGVCGTCLTRVLEGQPDHRDLYLTDEERAANDQFTPCCSRAKSALLVLDV